MRIHVDQESMLFAFPEHANCVVDVVLVILPTVNLNGKCGDVIDDNMGSVWSMNTAVGSTYGPLCSMLSHVVTYRSVLKPQLLSRFRC